MTKAHSQKNADGQGEHTGNCHLQVHKRNQDIGGEDCCKLCPEALASRLIVKPKQVEPMFCGRGDSGIEADVPTALSPIPATAY